MTATVRNMTATDCNYTPALFHIGGSRTMSDLPWRLPDGSVRPCSVTGCVDSVYIPSEKARDNLLCFDHLQKFKEQYPRDVPRSRGPAFVNNGYTYVYKPDHPNAAKSGYVSRGVLVMSEHLGRPLRPHERVHRIDRDRSNDDLSNLELWTTMRPPKNAPLADHLLFATHLLAEYGVYVEVPDVRAK